MKKKKNSIFKKKKNRTRKKRTQRPQPADEVPHAQVHRRPRRAQVRRRHVPDHDRRRGAPHLGEAEAHEQGGERRAVVRGEDVEGEDGGGEEGGAAGEEVAPSGAGEAFFFF